MIRKWHTMALPVLALTIAMSGVLPTKVWSEDAERRFLWTLLPGEEVESLPTKMLTIALGATVTPFIGIDEDGEEVGQAYSAVTQFIDIDEDGMELDRVAIVAPARLNLVEGQKYQLKIVNASASILPSSGNNRPATNRIRVVLPAASGPIRPVTFPC